MGFRFPSMVVGVKQILKLQPLRTRNQHHDHVPKGHVAVYVGDDHGTHKRFVVPLSFLNHPLFRELLRRAEDEFGFDHPMGGLTIPCREDAFVNLTSQLTIKNSRSIINLHHRQF